MKRTWWADERRRDEAAEAAQAALELEEHRVHQHYLHTGMAGLDRATFEPFSDRVLARWLGIPHQEIASWRAAERVPEEYLYRIETITGVSAKELRPDLCR